MTKFIILLGQGIFLGLIILLSKNIICPFKLFFHIPCPFCGMTRAFYLMLNLNLKDSLYHNYLVIIISFFVILLDLFMIVNDKLLQKINIKLVIKIITFLVFISWFLNIRHGI